jgi:hypothetical protein
MPTVTISFWNLQDEHHTIRTFIFKDDSPGWSEAGTQDDFRHHEVLQLLVNAGMADAAAQEFLELINRDHRVHRRQFRLRAEQFEGVSRCFQEPIP